MNNVTQTIYVVDDDEAMRDSMTWLLEGEGYQVVVQVKTTADAKSKNFRIPLLTHTCKGCSNAEYACICDE